jgi:DNA-binding transcriptional ArsR family regulator
VSTPVIEPEIESEETTYWVEEEMVEPEPTPVMNPILARSIGDDLRSRTPTPPPSLILTPPLDLGRISNLNDGEIAIVEAATAREISPSDSALQAYLAVGRPRLSQIFNSLQKAGVLTVRKKGRTRLFRLSDAANAHLSGGHMEG